MNHAQLKAFHAVAENGGFSAAAKTLGLTQPAITLQVQALEQVYNTKLFVRRGRRTEITAAGRMLLSLSKRIFNLENEAHSLLSSLDKLEIGELKITATSSLQSFPLLAAFQEKYPAIHLSFTATNSRQLENRILDFQSDIAISEAPSKDKRFFSLKLGDAPLKLAVSINHPWAIKQSGSLGDIKDLRLVYPFEDGMDAASGHWSHKLDHDPARIMRLESKEIRREAVAHNLGVSLFTEQEAVADSRIHLLDIEDANLKESIYLTCLKEVQHSRLISSFFTVAAAH
ncbi:LysR substrate-binding domain-containing protein [Sneathiella sp.]|uniref:LysR substrate-binding domain-containing protein n=1 Tax=Sneathiella sp. TaxID=1964365 RepID=UPI0035616EEF